MFWPRVKLQQFIYRVYSWFNPLRTRAILSYNKHEQRIKRSIRQYGVTSQIARENGALRQFDHDEDLSRLGRWVWQAFMGQANRAL
jgi:hypothetical protein